MRTSKMAMDMDRDIFMGMVMGIDMCIDVDVDMDIEARQAMHMRLSKKFLGRSCRHGCNEIRPTF